jgi:prepilin-type N-terminal cleavage/methylation domain-containing protein
VKKAAGFTLIELMVALTFFLVVIAGAANFYIAQSRVRLSEQLGVTMEGNLRLGMDTVMFTLRNTGYGAPTTSFSSWIPWVAGFTANPMITTGANSTTPDTISVALCTSQPVAHLASGAASGATSLTLDSAASLDNANKRLIYINNNELAVIQSVSGNTINIDTNPTVTGPQGVSRAYATSTPICRVDVITYTVNTTTMKLTEDDNQGAGAQPIMDGVTNLKIVTTAGTAHNEYKVTLTAKSDQLDPMSAAYTYRSISSTASVRN